MINKKVLLKLWDTVGDEKYALMNKSHYSIAHEIICVCAVCACVLGRFGHV